MISLAGRQFKSPGPVASAFMADRQHRVRDILGPVGGGKTVTCVHDLLTNAALMPVCKDGLIHFRGVATVCAKFFNLTECDRAYYGLKDAQQTQVLQRMVEAGSSSPN